MRLAATRLLVSSTAMQLACIDELSRCAQDVDFHPELLATGVIDGWLHVHSTSAGGWQQKYKLKVGRGRMAAWCSPARPCAFAGTAATSQLLSIFSPCRHIHQAVAQCALAEAATCYTLLPRTRASWHWMWPRASPPHGSRRGAV